mmetsp:Transcript_116286/g.333951  ORF Transcript_116286/g.333951 Transcript_116286/m.333951 type:complete len:337 (-) Transcript_116286:75-1085(-)|eukprot:CAMPEP_0170256796 /NCGR_PEP_ID=MMETSP0116_2-20130129/28253_1 /TAXON_ID=400756 /ORGANISM="Durinskia baltica, Strain CSIRO CS-38" /LENGTH=336 /DNA_ID=CAMNT_0010507809 /DNA_START=61 /DNA_END=1071 /DNA_ORIENTATION=+
MTSALKTEDIHLDQDDKDLEETNEISSDEDGKKEGSKSKKRPSPEPADDDKKAERRAANRRSAFQSRQRRKILIEDLQRTVNALSKDNGDLRKTNEELRVQLEATMLENHQFRMQQQLAGSNNPPSGLLGSSALQSAQLQALLRGGGQSALSQLLASSATPGLGLNTSVSGTSSSDAQDPLLNARLALAAAKTRNADAIGQSQGSTTASTQASGENKGSSSPTSSSSPPAANGIQGILNAASLANGVPGAAGLAGLQSLLQNPAMRNAQLTSSIHPGLVTGGAQLAGLQGLLDQLRGAGSSPAVSAGGLTDLQRVLLQGQDKINVSDALRSLLQKN